jgi:hypothetical protein
MIGRWAEEFAASQDEVRETAKWISEQLAGAYSC